MVLFCDSICKARPHQNDVKIQLKSQLHSLGDMYKACAADAQASDTPVSGCDCLQSLQGHQTSGMQHKTLICHQANMAVAMQMTKQQALQSCTDLH